MKIAVLGGGNSTEREVSLRSAKAAAAALITAGFEVIELDPVDFKILDSILPGTIVFPILHGQNGEDGVIQAELEKRKLAYLGSKSTISKICFDKSKTRQAFMQANLPVAAGDTVTTNSYKEHPLAIRPHVLKVNEGGSSIGTYLVRDPSQVDIHKVSQVFELDDKAVIEELVTGVEITVPILDSEALPVIEIKPPTDGEFDYLNKYNGQTQELCPPMSIDDEAQHNAQDYAKQAHIALGCRHLSRTDIIVRSDGSMVLLEINTIPGMTDQSLYPKAAQAAGISFPDLMKRFVLMVKRDYGL